MAKNTANSPLERNSLVSLDQKLAMAKRCSHGTYVIMTLISLLQGFCISLIQSQMIVLDVVTTHMSHANLL